MSSNELSSKLSPTKNSCHFSYSVKLLAIPHYQKFAHYISLFFVLFYILLLVNFICALFFLENQSISSYIFSSQSGWLICNLVLNCCLMYGIAQKQWLIFMGWLAVNVVQFFVYAGTVTIRLESYTWFNYLLDSFFLGLYIWALWVIYTLLKLVRLEKTVSNTLSVIVETQ